MHDLISRQAAIDEVVAWLNDRMSDKKNGKPLTERLRDLPSAQPQRKKGKWIDETFKPWGLVHHPYKCDQCGEHSETDSDFCPNCGADMRGGQDDS